MKHPLGPLRDALTNLIVIAHYLTVKGKSRRFRGEALIQDISFG